MSRLQPLVCLMLWEFLTSCSAEGVRQHAQSASARAALALAGDNNPVVTANFSANKGVGSPLLFGTDKQPVTAAGIAAQKSAGLTMVRVDLALDGIVPNTTIAEYLDDLQTGSHGVSNPANWNWGGWNSYAGVYHQQGFKIMVITDYTPTWLSYNQSTTHFMPANWTVWQDIVAKTYAHINGQFDYIEVFNEPTNFLGYSGSGSPYTSLESAYADLYYYTTAAIRTVNKTTPIGGPVIGCPFSVCAIDLIGTILNDPRSSGNVNFISYHDYNEGLNADINDVATVREQVASTGHNLPIFISEWGSNAGYKPVTTPTLDGTSPLAVSFAGRRLTDQFNSAIAGGIVYSEAPGADDFEFLDTNNNLVYKAYPFRLLGKDLALSAGNSTIAGASVVSQLSNTGAAINALGQPVAWLVNDNAAGATVDLDMTGLAGSAATATLYLASAENGVNDASSPSSTQNLAISGGQAMLTNLYIPGYAVLGVILTDNGSASTSGSVSSTVNNGAFTQLTSPNGQYTFVLQDDGNVVLYNGAQQASNALWESATYNVGTGPYHAYMQADGNLVAYQSNGGPIWSTKTYNQGTGPYTLAVLNNGNVTATDSTGKLLWQTNTGTPASVSSTVNNGAFTTLMSPNGQYTLTMQTDGNLVLYNGTQVAANAGWSSQTYGQGTGPYRALMQVDGNLVIYQANGGPIWSSKTYDQGTGPYTLSVSNSGLVTATDATNAIIWQE